jgi:hypothetical protein
MHLWMNVKNDILLRQQCIKESEDGKQWGKTVHGACNEMRLVGWSGGDGYSDLVDMCDCSLIGKGEISCTVSFAPHGSSFLYLLSRWSDRMNILPRSNMQILLQSSVKILSDDLIRSEFGCMLSQSISSKTSEQSPMTVWARIAAINAYTSAQSEWLMEWLWRDCNSQPGALRSVMRQLTEWGNVSQVRLLPRTHHSRAQWASRKSMKNATRNTWRDVFSLD